MKAYEIRLYVTIDTCEISAVTQPCIMSHRHQERKACMLRMLVTWAHSVPANGYWWLCGNFTLIGTGLPLEGQPPKIHPRARRRPTWGNFELSRRLLTDRFPAYLFIGRGVVKIFDSKLFASASFPVGEWSQPEVTWQHILFPRNTSGLELDRNPAKGVLTQAQHTLPAIGDGSHLAVWPKCFSRRRTPLRGTMGCKNCRRPRVDLLYSKL